jgi:YidC/Oxa1 family membrane protein insertase
LGNLFGFISNPFEQILALMALLVGSAGIAIILFTVIIRLILSPLQIVQLRSARAMQKLQPHIAELRKKHGKDKQKLTEETMKLYKEHKVNPAMGCLPMLLQFPVLIGLFWALRALADVPIVKVTKTLLKQYPHCLHGAIVGKTVNITPTCWHLINPGKGAWFAKIYHATLFHHLPLVHGNAADVYNLFHARFLWLSNGLGGHDPLYILPVLAGVTQWIQSRMMMQKSTDPQQQSMAMLMNFTPLIIVFFALNYPSGLSLYWVTSTILGILISVRITGWGTIPRLDRMLLGTQTAPSRAMVSSRPKASRGAAPKADINGQATEADIVVPSGEVDGVGANGDAQSLTNKAGAVRANGRQARRRPNRPRGGRRG